MIMPTAAPPVPPREPGAARPARRFHALAAALAVLAFAACEKAQPPVPPAGGLPVTTLQVATRALPITIEAVGRTEGSREVEVRARVSGILQKQFYAEGDTVRAGAPLFQIDRAPFEIALVQARAALSQESARNEQAQREAGRLKGLIEQRAIIQREADDASSTLKLSNASVQAAEAKVREAELNLSYTAVGAPIAGTTGRAQRSEGSLVTAGTDSSLLTTLTQTDPIWVRFALSEPEFAQLRATDAKKAEVRIALPNGAVLPVKGRLNFSGSTVDARLGTVQLRAEFPNPGLDLLPGQFVSARVIAGIQQAIAVPQTAVLQGDQGRFVWTVGADGKAAPRPVEAGGWVGPDWVIKSGLKAGDTVIVDNLLKLRPGTPVQAGAKPEAKPEAKSGG